jgi:hypothetical protein
MDVEPNFEAEQSTRGFNVIFIHSTLDDAGLTPDQFRVFAHVSRRASSGKCTAAGATMAKICRIHPDTLKRCIAELVRRKMLNKTERPGRTNLWRITSPDEWDLTCNTVDGKRKPGRPKAYPLETKGGDPLETKGGDPLETKGAEGSPSQGDPSKGGREILPPEAIEWNAVCGSLGKVVRVANSRMDHLNTRRKDWYWVVNYSVALRKIMASSFCRGEKDGKWRASFDWIVGRPEAITKIMEGKYDDRTPANGDGNGFGFCQL